MSPSPNVSVQMMRPHLNKLPSFEMPASYTLRTYQPGDEKAWTHIHIHADPYNKFDDTSFQHQFGNDQHLLSENQFYVCDAQNQAIGTATAWTKQIKDNAAPDGLVHWIAIHPDHQGKKLANPLLSAVCHRLKERGFARVYLNTSSGRLPALGLYLKFGFVPNIRRPEERDAWLAIRQQLSSRAIGLDKI